MHYPEAKVSSRECADSSTHLERKKYKLHVRVFLSRYRGYTICPRILVS